MEGKQHRYSSFALTILQILHEFTPLVEPCSIDEAFLEADERDSLKIAHGIKQKIRERLNVTCSIGVAANKTVAKMASEAGGTGTMSACWDWASPTCRTSLI
ncbi:MAG: hypothetical protein ACM3WV_08495 [Bacillota bacterium]